MNPLERRYRLLLAVYPPDHRAVFQEEMIGVLMEGASPDQRYPRPRETANLLAVGLWRRLGGTAGGLTDRRWADAALVVGLIGLLLLFVNEAHVIWEYMSPSPTPEGPVPEGPVAVDHPGYGVLFWTMVLFAVAWLIPVGALLVGWRTPAALAALPLVTWDGKWFLWLVGKSAAIDPPHLIVWFTVGVTAAVALCMPGGRPVRWQLGWRRIGLLIGAAGVLAAIGYVEILQGDYRVVRLGDIGFSGWAMSMAVFAAGLTGYVVLRLEPGVRRRVLALVTPILVQLVVITYDVFNFGSEWRRARSITEVHVDGRVQGWGEVLVLMALPLVVFAIAVVAVRQRERTLHMVDLGREREREIAARTAAHTDAEPGEAKLPSAHDRQAT